MDAPRNVRLVYPEGDESDSLPVVYIGYDHDEDLDVFEACPPDSRRYIGVIMDRMPARSMLQIALWAEGE